MESRVPSPDVQCGPGAMVEIPFASPGAFPATRASLVRAAASADGETRRQAFGALAEGYWRPVYKYLRWHWHADPAEAEDLTQGFFARAYEKRFFDRFDPGRARFRTFLRTCLDGYVANERQAATRLKRGGGAALLSLDVEGAERELAGKALASAVDERCHAQDRTAAFTVFRRYDLEGEDGERPTYEALGRELGLPVTQVTNHLSAMRRELRREVLEALRALTASDEEFRAEARDLLGVATP